MTPHGFPLKTIIVDVDVAAADDLYQMLTGFSFVHVCELFDKHKQVLEYVNKFHVELVFLDMQLVIRVGLSLILDLVNDQNQNIAVVFMSERNDQSINGALRLAGFYFLEKPVEMENLKETLRKIKADHISGNVSIKTASMIEKISS